ncbi:S41 family peptidase [Croceitalea marina]|uniref:S41 family peptidase n=1 Tax=Croceitalea marina TaxID=1775166 RepID=A0ABW5N2R4_9FLAO
MKKWLKRLVITLLGGGLLLILVFAIFYNRFVVEAPQREYPQPTSLKEKQHQDLEYLALFVDKDRSFDTQEKRTLFFKHIDSIKLQLPLENHKFVMSVAKIMAQAENTHTNVAPSELSKHVNTIPIRFYWFDSDLHVVLAQSPYQELLGVKITKINGRTPLDLLQLLEPWYGGNHNRLRFFSPLYFMSPEILDAVGHGYAKNAIALVYEDYLGTERHMIMEAVAENRNSVGYWPPHWLNRNLMKSKKNWYHLNSSISQPMPFQNTNSNVWHKMVENVLYVQLNENVHSETVNINEYLNEVLNEVKNKSLESTIMDLRFNPGGDYNIARSFIKKINKRLDGNPFYIITGNGTFSAGIMTAAIAKDVAKENIIVVGEPIGDYLQFWADGGSEMVLPNSKIRLRIWTAYHDWQNGCSDWSKCFWITIFDGVAVEHLDPDKRVPLQFSDYMLGEDSALNTILKMQD